MSSGPWANCICSFISLCCYWSSMLVRIVFMIYCFLVGRWKMIILNFVCVVFFKSLAVVQTLQYFWRRWLNDIVDSLVKNRRIRTESKIRWCTQKSLPPDRQYRYIHIIIELTPIQWSSNLNDSAKICQTYLEAGFTPLTAF